MLNSHEMKNIWIQSFIDDNGNTTLEVGKGECFTSVPSNFDVVHNGTCFKTISEKDYTKLRLIYGVTHRQIQDALSKTWGANHKIIFSVSIKNF